MIESDCGYCYVGKAANGEFKIGRSGSPNRRAYQIELGIGMSFELVVSHQQFRLERGVLETYLLTAFRHRRIRKDWFSLSEEDIELIRGTDGCRRERDLPKGIRILYLKNRLLPKVVEFTDSFGVAVEDLWSEAKS